MYILEKGWTGKSKYIYIYAGLKVWCFFEQSYLDVLIGVGTETVMLP